MNKTKIEWTDYTWNPVTGCLRNCYYCYVKRLKNYDQTPTFHPDRMGQPFKVKKPARIFVCSTADLFAEWNQNRCIRLIMRVVEKCPQHTFQFLTKSPEGYNGWEFPENCWLGVTVTESGQLDKLAQSDFFKTPNFKFISFEPLLGPIHDQLPGSVSWIILGAMTGSHSEAHKPDPIWIQNILLKAAQNKTAVFLKNNLKGIWPGEFKQEFPK